MSTHDAAAARARPLTQLHASEQAWRERVRQFAHERLQPLVSAMDEDAQMPSELLEQLFAAQLMGIAIPERLGGTGRSFFEAVLAIEELSRVDPGVAVCVDVQNALVAVALARYGSPEQQQRYLPRLARDTVGAYAMSERGAGSDGFAITTRAERSAASYVLRGEKAFTTNAAEAGLFVVIAKTADSVRPELTALLVERTAPGVSIGERQRKLGIRASSTCMVTFDDVRVPLRDVLGAVGQGGEIAAETLNEGRVGIAAQMLGLAQGAFDAAYAYAGRRRQFGSPIIRFQAVHFALAEMATQIEATRLLVYNAARALGADSSSVERFRAPAMAKYFASQVAERVASQALEIFGGNGFLRDYPAEKLYRDAKIGSIYEGTSNMLLRTISMLLAQSAAAPDDGSHDSTP